MDKVSSSEKSILQFGIGILGNGFKEKVEASESEYADINAGINTSWEFNPYSPWVFKLFNLSLIINLFLAKRSNVGELFKLSSFTNAVLIVRNDNEKWKI